MSDLRNLQIEIHRNAKEHGWWDKPRNIPEMLALVHSEVSEALEAYRDGDMALRFDANGKPEGFPAEMADIIIRVLDMAEGLKLNLDEAINVKHKYNKSRPYRHGGKLA